jgi:hypothetical protein
MEVDSAFCAKRVVVMPKSLQVALDDYLKKINSGKTI